MLFSSRSMSSLLPIVLLLSSLVISVLATESANTDSAATSTSTSTIARIGPDCNGRLVLATGATGRLGRIATHLLLEQDFCVRVFTRNVTSAKEKLGHLNYEDNNSIMEFVQGDLGDQTSFPRAFAPRHESGEASVSHVVYAAGGEEADFDAVNNRGLTECAKEAAKAGTKSMVVISAAWVSKPYSLASILFNLLYPNLPMAKHLQGEDALRRQAQESGLNYVIIRAGRLVTDEEYPADAPAGLWLKQKDAFDFFGPAGMPGMCYTQLAHAVTTALQIEGRYTVEMTSGDTDRDDPKIYSTLVQDGDVRASYEDIERIHAKALADFKKLFLVVVLILFGFILRFGWIKGTIFAIMNAALCVYWWSNNLADSSVDDCLAAQAASSYEL